MATSPSTAPAVRLVTDDFDGRSGAVSNELLQAAIDAYLQDPGSAGLRADVKAAARSMAEQAALLSKRDPESNAVREVKDAIRALSASGIHDYALTEDDRAFMASRRWNHWPHLLGAMVIGSAWQWGDAPALDSTPQWLWGDYAEWLFYAPQGFTAVGDAERYAKFILGRLEEFARLVERNTGSAAVRSAGEGYLRRASGIPLYFSEGSLRRHAELRGRILRRLVGRESSPYDPMPFPRAGRRLRIGFAGRHFGPQTETYSILAYFEHLDPERFEVILFSLREVDTELAQYCRSKAQDFRLMPLDLAGQLSILRDANLDVLVFSTNVTAVTHEITRLAFYRIAPLQVVTNASCITTGIPEVDLFVSGETTEAPEAPEQFTERLGLLPMPAHSFEYEADKQEATTEWTRAALGIPDGAMVFASAANYYKVIPEMQETWAKLLAAVSGSYLLVHPFNPNWSATYPIKRFCAEFDRVLDRHGVSRDRLIVSTNRFPSRSDVPRLMSVGDLYLDTFPFAGVNSLVDPLEAGIPALAWEGRTFRARMAGAILRSIGLPELIATNEAEYLEKAKALIAAPEDRRALGDGIKAAIERGPVFLDTLAASDAFGDLIEAAFDVVVEKGLEAFRREKTPFSAAAIAGTEAFDQLSLARAELRRAPASSAARHALGNALLAAGNSARAAEYLLAAIQSDERNASLWFNLAEALRASNQIQQALQALEASLKLNVANAAGWRMVKELAEAVGAFELAGQADTVLQHFSAGTLPAGVSPAA